MKEERKEREKQASERSERSRRSGLRLPEANSRDSSNGEQHTSRQERPQWVARRCKTASIFLMNAQQYSASADDPRCLAIAQKQQDCSKMKMNATHLQVQTAAEIAIDAALNAPIALDEVADSLSKLRNGKASGCDGIVAEVLKKGGSIVAKVLHQQCAAAFSTGVVPSAWMRGIVVPLHKDGDLRVPANYRPITLLSVVAKVYTGVLLARLQAVSERHGLIVPEQGGFRPGRGCPEQLFTLTELIKLRRLRKRNTYACFIDVRKAYDTVWLDGLRLCLLRKGIRGSFYRAVCSLYEACESCLRLEMFLSIGLFSTMSVSA